MLLYMFYKNIASGVYKFRYGSKNAEVDLDISDK